MSRGKSRRPKVGDIWFRRDGVRVRVTAIECGEFVRCDDGDARSITGLSGRGRAFDLIAREPPATPQVLS